MNTIFQPTADLTAQVSQDPVFIAARDREKALVADLKAKIAQAVEAQSKAHQFILSGLLVSDTEQLREQNGHFVGLSLLHCRGERRNQYHITLRVSPVTLIDGKPEAKLSMAFALTLTAFLTQDNAITLSDVTMTSLSDVDNDDTGDDGVSRSALVLNNMADLHAFTDASGIVSRFAQAVLSPEDNPTTDALRQLLAAHALKSDLDDQCYDYRSRFGRSLITAWRKQYRHVTLDDLQSLWQREPGTRMRIACFNANTDDTRPVGHRVVLCVRYYEIAVEDTLKGRQLVDRRACGYDGHFSRWLQTINTLLSAGGQVEVTQQINHFLAPMLILPDTANRDSLPRNTVIIHTASA